MDRGELYDEDLWIPNEAFSKAAESLQEIGKAYSTPAPDEVNHPSRYLHKGIETIDVIKAWTEGLDGAYAFCIGNAIKYLSRWQEKGGIEDLKKAVWYIQWVIDNG